MIIAAMIVSDKGYYIVWPCAKIADTIAEGMDLVAEYPACAAYADSGNMNAVSAVLANMNGGSAANAGAALNVNFGMALWLAFAIHAIGVEVYVSRVVSFRSRRDVQLVANTAQLHLTPREAQRLRQVSYTRQLEAGMHNPGSAGLTTDRLGDAEQWVPEQRRDSSSTLSNFQERAEEGGK